MLAAETMDKIPAAATAVPRRPRRMLRIVAFALLLATAALVFAAIFGVPIDAGAQRAPLARLLSSQLGRPVAIDGRLQLRIGLRPRLQVQGLRIGQPAGFGADDFLRVGEMEFRLDLWPLLNRQFRADRVAARDVTLALREHDDDTNNWTFGTASAPEAPERPDSGGGWSARDAAGIDLRQLELEDIRVSWQSGSARALEFRLDKLDAALPIDGSVALTASGKVERTMPYQLAISGGELRALLSGRPGWPLKLQLDFAGGRLDLDGRLGERDSAVRFALGTADLARFGKVVGVKLPDAGAAGLSGMLSLRPGLVRIDQLAGTLGKSAMGGWLLVDARGVRPKVSGALGMQALDLRPFLGQDDGSDAPTDLGQLYRGLSNARLDLQALNEFDADLELGVGQWLSLPGEIRNASLRVQVADGRLSMPVEATVEQVPMKGRLFADGRAAVPALSLSFSAGESPIGGLARFLAGVPGIDGRLGGLQLQLDAQGARGDALMRSLTASVQLRQSRLSYGNVAGGRPVDFTLERMKLAVGGSRPLEGELKGSLLGRPLTATLSGDSLRAAMEKGGSPIALTVQTGRIAARVSGSFNGVDQSADLTISLGAERAGDVAAWLGLNPKSELPIALAGRVRGTLQRWSLSQLVFRVGDSSLYSDVDQTASGDRQRLSAQLEIASVDLRQLDQLLPPPPPVKPGQKASLDIPILPAKLVLDDADVRVRAHDIRGSQLELGELGFDGHVRDGSMQSSPFFAEVAGTRYEGALALDLRELEPRAQLWVSAAPVDVGKLVRQLKLAGNIDSTVERLTLYLDSHSRRLDALIANATLSGEVSGGRLALRDENTKQALTMLLSRGSLSARPGERLTLDVSGSVDAVPVELKLRSATLKELADPQRRLPFELQADAVNTRLKLSGSVDRDIDKRDVELALELKGDKLDALDRLLRVSLPPWGPWSAAGRFRMDTRGYAVDALQLQVGSSSLAGRGTMDTRSGRPKIDVALEAPLIQLDDFGLKGWSALDDKPAAADDGKADPDALRKKAVDASDRVQGLLSRETLSQADATLSVRVGQVKSGKDLLGNGQLDARLANGRAEIGPVRISMPGGDAHWRLSYEPRERDVLAALKVDIDNFDYGVIGRRLKPDSDLAGRFSARIDVNSRAPRLSQMLANGNGRIDFAVWPTNLRSGVFDMWAVNLFVALLPTLDPKNESVVNCAVGRFALKDGKLAQEQLVIDTSRMRVTGTTAVDFDAEKIRMRLQPQAKTAQFLSLSTPIEVNGSFSQFDVGPNAGDVMQTVIRLATSIFWVPLQKLFSGKVPQDGADVCRVEFR